MATKPRKSLGQHRPAEAAPVLLQGRLFDDVRDLLREARRKAYAAANLVMVEAYWNIGRRIVQEEQGGKERAGYGSQLIRNLARQLGDEFGNGVSVANLKNFRQFYLTFPDAGKSYALRSQLTWTHWRMVMRVEDTAARDYYIGECAEQGWNTRTLERAIATRTYQRLVAAPAVSILAKPDAAPHPLEFIKDPYVVEFLGLPEHTTPDERRLEEALVTRLRDFLMELGKGFSFVARCFGELTAPLMAKIKTNSTESRTLATLRDILLPKLLSGEMSVTQQRN
jgi:predicted nuclease of restriction endonuclease-like (RecB) superfamily